MDKILDFVNAELQVIADEERELEIDERWVEEIGMQFLSSWADELVEDLG